MGKQTKVPKARQAESAELFTFALDPDWKEEIDPNTLECMRSIIADYEEAKRRCEAYRHRQATGNYRKDVQHILFSQDREDEITVDELYHEFERFNAYTIREALNNLRQSSWEFTPKADREVTLFSIMNIHVPWLREQLCDFRCGGYRLLGDILMDLNEQFETAAVQKHKGIRKGDSAQMKAMMRGAVDSDDYRQKLIQNCKSIIYPTRREARQVLEQIDWDDAVMCAEALGKRSFILEVMPSAALDLVIDHSPPEEDDDEEDLQELLHEKKAWWKFW